MESPITYFVRPEHQVQPPFEQALEQNPEFAEWLRRQLKKPTLTAPERGPMATGGIPYLHGYRNSASNNCGQAAIATVLDFYGKEIGVPRSLPDSKDGKNHWQDATALEKIARDGFTPDVVAGAFGTSGGRIRDAFAHYGLRNCNVGFSGVNDIGWGDCWTNLQNWVTSGHPCPALVDVGTLGGQWWAAHWPVVYRIDDQNVYVTNWLTPSIPKDTFLAAWACHWLPYGYNHCFVTAKA